MDPSQALSAIVTTCATRRVIVAVRHAPMRELITAVLARDGSCCEAGHDESPASTPGYPPLLIADATDFPTCCDRFSVDRAHVIVVTPEPGSSYGDIALQQGAGAYIARDDLDELLLPILHEIESRARRRR